MITRDEIINEMFKAYQQKGTVVCLSPKNLETYKNNMEEYINSKYGDEIQDIQLDMCFCPALGIATDISFFRDKNGDDTILQRNSNYDGRRFIIDKDIAIIKMKEQSDISISDFKEFFKENIEKQLSNDKILQNMQILTMKN
ncbi:hypothetical protein [Gluconobacter cerinus]|uniref:hypothetical protein n=1 Tax=Gluconobacter cerinus TaxID=38307 RepID=UPI001B8B77D1|nr:hypothetical protein [Gluconobacter cerinus]MBS1038122.1 hypothetical protein [Gluconobacter cerinus]